MDDAHAQQAQVIDRLLDGYQYSAVLIAIARLRLADAFADTPADAGAIAAACGLQEAPLRRLLCLMARLGLCTQDEAGRHALTEAGCLLRSAPPGYLYQKAMLIDSQYRESWQHLDYSLRTGQPAFDLVHGQSVWEYRERNPQAAAHFQAWLGTLTAQHATQLAPSLCTKLDALGAQSVADLGGGSGLLLAEVLRRRPAMQGVLVDLPQAAVLAATTLHTAGVASRCRIVEASFFDAIPAQADCYLLKSILHDWNDDQAASLLRRLRGSLAAGSRLVVIERTFTADAPLEALMLDLRMLLVTGGQERSAQEYRALLAKARFDVCSADETASGFTILEAIAA